MALKGYKRLARPKTAPMAPFVPPKALSLRLSGVQFLCFYYRSAGVYKALAGLLPPDTLR